MSTKTRKPRLTRAMADKLLSLCGYAECEADELLSSAVKDDRDHAREVLDACKYVRTLAYWKLNQDTTP